MADKTEQTVKVDEPLINEEIKKVSLNILKVEENAIMVNIDGWRRRIYFEDGFDASILHKNKDIEIQYKGDITDPFKVEFLKLK